MSGEEVPESRLDAHFETIQRRLANVTLPLVPVAGDGEGEPGSSIGSGLLVELGSRYFVLSAGHCVEKFCPDTASLFVAHDRHHFMVDVLDRQFTFDFATLVDIGYIEIARPADGEGPDTFWQAALTLADIVDLNLRQAHRTEMLLVCGGFPAAVQEPGELGGSNQDTSGVLAYFYSPFLSEMPTGKCHSSEFHIAMDIPTKLLLVHGAGERSVLDRVPKLSGASGGGVWVVEPKELQDGFSETSMKLSGLYVQTKRTDGIPVFLRAIKVTETLKLVAKNNPDLAESTAITAAL